LTAYRLKRPKTMINGTPEGPTEPFSPNYDVRLSAFERSVAAAVRNIRVAADLGEVLGLIDPLDGIRMIMDAADRKTADPAADTPFLGAV